MAIEVILRGKPPARRVYHATCPTCRSRLKFRRGDTRQRDAIIDERSRTLRVIARPVCDRSFEVTHIVEC
jgi:hypothetical protein